MDYSKFKVAELKQELTKRHLSTAGRKEELVTRLQRDDAFVPVSEIDFSKVKITKWKPPSSPKSPKTANVKSIIEIEKYEAYDTLKIVELKKLLKERRLPVSGKKNILVERLEESDKIYKQHYLLVHPRASTFVEWLGDNMKKFKIPFKEKDTQGDYYQFIIGVDGDLYTLDWKHLSKSEIEEASNMINLYGYGIEYIKKLDAVRWAPLKN